MEKILITPKSFKAYSSLVYPVLMSKGYGIVENTLGRTLTEAEILELAHRDVVGVIIGVDPLPGYILEQCKDLRAISKYGVGMDNIDLFRASELGIRVKNAAGTNSTSVAELAIGLMFTAARNISVCAGNTKNGSWSRSMGFELTGKKLGLIGCGQIGKKVVSRAAALEMQVGIFDPYFDDQSFLTEHNVISFSILDQLLTSCDIVSLHLPATSETTHIINQDSLSKMKSTAVLINTSRGELIDEEALYHALKDGIIAGAASDVFSSEPPPKDERLLSLENFILTPHIGAFTTEAVRGMVEVSTQNLFDMLNERIG